MRAGLLTPLLLLAGVGVGAALTARAARQQRQLERRLEAMVPAPPPVILTAPTGHSIRMARMQASRWDRAARLLSMPVDLPLANVVQPVWVFVLATAGAAASLRFGHALFSWPVCSLMALVVWLTLARGIFAWELGRYQAKLLRQLPDTIQLVVSTTRAGLPVSEAFHVIGQEMASPTREEFIRVENEMALGIGADEALLNLHKRTGVTEYAIFAVTIGVQARSGGRLAETIENLAETVRERLTIAARAQALASEAKTSAVIMAVLPVVASVMMSIVRPGHMDPLFNDPRGIKMFAFGLGTLILGGITMLTMIKGATRD